MIARVAAEAGAAGDPLAGLVRIGIDELSHRKGQRYLTVAVDHDSGRLVWARPGRDKATMEAFFDELGDDQAARLRLVSADAGSWITEVVDRRAPNAARCMDPFHVVAWAGDALDAVRRQT
jgi:transposase